MLCNLLKDLLEAHQNQLYFIEETKIKKKLL